MHKLTILFTSLLSIFTGGSSKIKLNRLPLHPNVVFIISDDLNDWVGFLHGNPDVKTPNLDRLAKQSIIFADAHAPATLCNPSRAAILTSQYPSHTKVYDNEQNPEEAIVQAKLKTIMESFKDADYTVLGTGKIFHRDNAVEKYYDEYFYTSSRPDTMRLRGQNSWGIWDKDESELSDSKKTNWAIKKLEEQHDKPFLMIVGYDSPHLPWVIPQKYVDLYNPDTLQLPITQEDDTNDIPETIRTASDATRQSFIDIKNNGRWKEMIRAYLASISYLDKQIGDLLNSLETSAYAKNTIIVFIGDHGFHMGEKDIWQKNTLWERSTHVPMLIYIPEQKEQERIYNNTVSLIDIYPTLIELCHLAAQPNLDGLSLVKLIQNPSIPWNHAAVTMTWSNNYSVQTQDWHYIQYYNQEEELYNRAQDPHEFTNLAKDSQYHTVINKLKTYIPK